MEGGLDRIIDSANSIHRAFDPLNLLSPKSKNLKVAEGLGKIKETYDYIQSAYNRDQKKSG